MMKQEAENAYRLVMSTLTREREKLPEQQPEQE